ncbi:hypothetical protein D9M69_567870 [compost metagenome]
MGAVDFKAGDTADRQVGTRASLGGADHQTRRTRAVGHDVGRNTITRLCRVDGVPGALQGRIGWNRDIVISAILTDFQSTTRNGTGGTASKRSTGYFRAGGQVIHNNAVSTGNGGIVRSCTQDRRGTRSCGIARKRRIGLATEIGQRRLKGRQCAFQGTDTGDLQRVGFGLSIDLRLFRRFVGIDQRSNDRTDIQARAQARTR